MIREVAVQLKINAAGDIRAEGGKHVVGIESADSVARVDRYFHRAQRMQAVGFRVNALDYHISQQLGVALHEAAFNAFAIFAAYRVGQLGGGSEYIGNVAAVKPAVTGEEFEAVPVLRVVACGYLHSAVAAHLNRRHKHCGGRAKGAVRNAHSV